MSDIDEGYARTTGEDDAFDLGDVRVSRTEIGQERYDGHDPVNRESLVQLSAEDWEGSTAACGLPLQSVGDIS
jgi:hypothetical protein